MMNQMPPLSPLTPFNIQPQPSLDQLPFLQTNEEIWNDVLHTFAPEQDQFLDQFEKLDLHKLLYCDLDMYHKWT